MDKIEIKRLLDATEKDIKDTNIQIEKVETEKKVLKDKIKELQSHTSSSLLVPKLQLPVFALDTNLCTRISTSNNSKAHKADTYSNTVRQVYIKQCKDLDTIDSKNTSNNISTVFDNNRKNFLINRVNIFKTLVKRKSNNFQTVLSLNSTYDNIRSIYQSNVEIKKKYSKKQDDIVHFDPVFKEIVAVNRSEQVQIEQAFKQQDIPSMLIGDSAKRKFNNTNHIITDPKKAFVDDNNTIIWTAEEQDTFFDLYCQDPKNFAFIAQNLHGKTENECVRFYYDSKGTVNFKDMVKTRKIVKRTDLIGLPKVPRKAFVSSYIAADKKRFLHR